MRVRPTRDVLNRRPRRRAHATPRAADAAIGAPAPAEDFDTGRARRSGGPIDRAQYTCGCGLVFDAAVSTSVACPHCGATQAW